MVKEKAYAKINLFLNVLNKRPDGYHDLDMIMAPLKLHDTLTFKRNKKNQSIELSCSRKIMDQKQDNLVYKIAKSLKETFDVKKGVHIHLDKQIPMGAGLAGGSADAAATLRGLNKLWKLGLSTKELSKIGEQFGADIPFCIYNQLCIARGKGEELLFLNQKLHLNILLVTPNIEVSTKAVFKQVTESDLIEKTSHHMANAIYNKNYELILRELFNSLEKITFKLKPKVKKLKEEFKSYNLDGVLMSGSGASVFAIDKSKKKLKNMCEEIDNSYYKLITKIK
ncbi:MAG: 4-(cytidine 5'-diphospho)-2-C-methyl-D-erythritol kinase [Candidatus Izimaplasma sp.]|nr:4-(cytidine 5'-diphospho)-2-C-methyl-D-erythritol kinase [Candidatus Izimaplasma bacterium]